MSPSGSPRARWRKTDLVDETPRLARSGETALRINRKSGAGGQSGSRAVGQPYEAGPTWALCRQIRYKLLIRLWNHQSSQIIVFKAFKVHQN